MQIIQEDNKTAAEKLLSKNTKLSDVEKVDFFNKFYELDPTHERYPNDPRYLITLIKWFLEDPTIHQFAVIKSEFETYLEQAKKNQWRGVDVVIKDIAKFKKFEDFANEVQRISAKYNKDGEEIIKDTGNTVEVLGKKINRSDITYMTDEVVVAEADSLRKSIAYGSGFSDWCTARKESNYYYRYKFGNYGEVGESTMYFVYFPKRYEADPNDSTAVLHFGVNKNGLISYTDRENNESIETLNWLKSTFKEFKDVPDMRKIFPFKQIDDEEKKIYSLSDEINDTQFYNLSNKQKAIYLQTGDRVINLNKFKSMNDTLKSLYLGMIENYSSNVLEADIFDVIKNTAYGKRYISNLDSYKIETLLGLYENDFKKCFEFVDLLIKYKANNIESSDIFSILISTSSENRLAIATKIGPFLKKLNADDAVRFLSKVENLKKWENIFSEYFTSLSGSYLRTFISRTEDAEGAVYLIVKYIDVSTLPDSTLIYILERNAAYDFVDPDELIKKSIEPRIKEGTLTIPVAVVMINQSNSPLEIAQLIGLDYIRTNMSSDLISTCLMNSTSNKLDQIAIILGHKSFLKLNNSQLQRILNSTMYSSELNLKMSYLIIKELGTNLTESTIFELFKNAGNLIHPVELATRIGEENIKKLQDSNIFNLIITFNHLAYSIQIFGEEKIANILSQDDMINIFEEKILNDVYRVNKKIYQEYVQFAIKHYTLSTRLITEFLKVPENIITMMELIGKENCDLIDLKQIENIITARAAYGSAANVIEIFKNKILNANPDEMGEFLQKIGRGGYIRTQYTINLLIKNNYLLTGSHIAKFLTIADQTDSLATFTDAINIVGETNVKKLTNTDINFMFQSGFKNNINILVKYHPLIELDGDNIFNIVDILLDKSNIPEDLISYFGIENLKKIRIHNLWVLYTYKFSKPQKILFIDFLIKYKYNELTSPIIYQILVNVPKDKINDTVKKLGVQNLNKLRSVDINNLMSPYVHKSIRIVYFDILTPENIKNISNNLIHDLLSVFYDDKETLLYIIKKLVVNYPLNEYDIERILLTGRHTTNSIIEFAKILGGENINRFTGRAIASVLYALSGSYTNIIQCVNAFGKSNLTKLEATQLIGLIKQFRLYYNSTIVADIMFQFGISVINKLTSGDIVQLISNKYLPEWFVLFKYIGDRKIDVNVINTLKYGNYILLNKFAHMYYYGNNNNKVDRDFLKIIDYYISLHGNKFGYADFESILRVIEHLPNVRDNFFRHISKYIKSKLYSYLKTYNFNRSASEKIMKEYKRYYLELLTEDSSFSEENLQKILDIERKAYPTHMQMINRYISGGGTLKIEDIADYLDCKINDIIFYVGENWFIIGAKRGDFIEIGDWACIGGMTLNMAKQFFKILYKYKDYTFECDARSTTSYPIIKRAEKMGYLQVLSESEWDWYGVKMISLKFKFNI